MNLIFIIILECLALIICENRNSVIVRANRRASVSKFGNYEYWMFSDRRTWPEAVLQCEKEGTEIAEVRSMEEAKRLVQFMMRNRPEAIESAWIGGYAKNKTQGITWRWISTNEEISRTILWRDLEKIIKNQSVRGCLLFDWHHWEEPAFIESPCDRKREYICQRMMNIEEPTSHQEAPTIPQTTPSTFMTSTVEIKFTSTSVKFTTDNDNHNHKNLNSSDYNITTIVPMNIRRRTKIELTTENYQDKEDYYDYDIKDDLMELKMSTKKPLKPTQIETKGFPRVFALENRGQPPSKSQRNFYVKPKERKDVKPLKSLKLYYAFEGPIVGGLNENKNSRSNSHFGRKYQKYIAVKRKPLRRISPVLKIKNNNS